MIELTTYVCVFQEGFIMGTDLLSADQRVSPTQVWAQLSPDLQVHIIRLVAQLAAHLVLAEEEHPQHTRKETCDALGSAFTSLTRIKVIPGLRPLVAMAFRLWSLKSGSSNAARS